MLQEIFREIFQAPKNSLNSTTLAVNRAGWAARRMETETHDRRSGQIRLQTRPELRAESGSQGQGSNADASATSV